MNAALAEIIIKIDTNDHRFEEFARQTCSLEHGIEFVPTSRTWDRGRDGRTTGSATSGFANLLCATLNREIDGKVEADLLRLTATSSPKHLIYCCSQPLSEHAIDVLDKSIRRHIPTGSITIYGSEQLAHLAAKHSQVFEKSYPAEINSVRTSLLERTETEDRIGLRLALITIGTDDGPALRREILRRTVLELLQSEGPQSAAMAAQTLSTELKLPRTLPHALIEGVLKKELREQTVTFTHDKWSLTAYGENSLSDVPPEATDYLLKGRLAIKEKLESLMGLPFVDSQYERVWSTLLDFLSALFYQNGLSVIQAIDAFLSGSQAAETPDLHHLLADGARKCAALLASTPETERRLQNAIVDTLTERSGPAFEWLTRTCERFVTLCCLGLESRSAQDLRAALIAHDVVLDSDVLLNYFCEGEPDHKATVNLLARWLQVGGRILLAPVVLEEVAYHSWISQTDFVQTEHLFGKLQHYELRRFIRNAFVRAFHAISKNVHQWDVHISQFRGNSQTDYSKIKNRLQVRLAASILPDNYDEKLAKDITAYSLREAARQKIIEVEDLEEDTRYKLGRDGRLLASVAQARASSAEIRTNNVLLLSSSHILQKAELKFSGRLGKKSIVLSRAGFAYLLSMIGDTQLGADTLRRTLFEFGKGARLTDSERRALRIIRSSGAYDLPWADRDLLKDQLSSAVHREAGKLGVTDQQLRASLSSGTAPDISAKVIADALRNMAKGTVSEDKLREAEQRIAQLETKLAATQDALKKAGTKAPQPSVHRSTHPTPLHSDQQSPAAQAPRRPPRPGSPRRP
jgi:predicted nucleic acid-binding protein